MREKLILSTGLLAAVALLMLWAGGQATVPEASAAYGRLLARGMAGDVSLHHSAVSTAYNDRSLAEPCAPWETPFAVDGYEGVYMTTRKYAALLDGGEDTPFLCVFDEEAERSFTLFGWDGQQVILLANVENGTGRWETKLLRDTVTGHLLLHRTGADGLTSHGSEEFAIHGGGLIRTAAWQRYYDVEREQWVEEQIGDYTAATRPALAHSERHTLQEMIGLLKR